MTQLEFEENCKKFSLPVSPEEIQWVIGYGYKGSDTQLLAHINARVVMDRLKDCFPMGSWKTDFTPFNYISKAGQDTAIKFSISFLVDGGWISFADVDGTGQVEPIKSAVSGASKRAAVWIGLGRELYDFPKVYIKGKIESIPDWAYPQLRELTKNLTEGKETRFKIVLEEKGELSPTKSSSDLPWLNLFAQDKSIKTERFQLIKGKSTEEIKKSFKINIEEQKWLLVNN